MLGVKARPPHMPGKCPTTVLHPQPSSLQIWNHLLLYIIGKLCLCCPPESIYLLVSKTFIGLNHLPDLKGTFWCEKQLNDVVFSPRKLYKYPIREGTDTGPFMLCLLFSFSRWINSWEKLLPERTCQVKLQDPAWSLFSGRQSQAFSYPYSDRLQLSICSHMLIKHVGS